MMACESSLANNVKIHFRNEIVDLMFLIDDTDSTALRAQSVRQAITETVNYLYQHLQTQGKLLRVGGIKFSNTYPNLLDPLSIFSNGVLRDLADMTDTNALATFNAWVNEAQQGGDYEYQLDILMFVKNMALEAYPRLYIALTTDEDSDSDWRLPIQDVATALTQAGCVVFIDPTISSLVSYYQPLAVNGGAVEQTSLGTFTFTLMRQAILGQ
jgi:hypothetical protein